MAADHTQPEVDRHTGCFADRYFSLNRDRAPLALDNHIVHIIMKPTTTSLLLVVALVLLQNAELVTGRVSLFHTLLSIAPL